MTINQRPDLWPHYKALVAQANSIREHYAGRAMPADAREKMALCVSTAKQLDAQMFSTPRREFKASAPAAPPPPSDPGWMSIDDRAPAMPAPLAKELPPGVSFKEAMGYGRVSDDACRNALGWLVKAAISPETDPAEVAKALSYVGVTDRKDMLSSGSAGVLIPSPIASFMIDLIRAQTVTLRLGATTVPMSSATVRVVRQTGDVTASWYGEAAAFTESDATFDSVSLTARKVGTLAKFSKELAEDGTEPASIGETVSRSIAAAFALELDRVALRGSGVAPQPLGIKGQSGVQSFSMGANGAAADWYSVVNWQGQLAQSNVNGSGVIMHPRTRWALAALKDGQNQPVRVPDAIRDLPIATTTALVTNGTKGSGTNLAEAFAGDWSQLMMGVRSTLSLQTLTELYAASDEIGVIGRGRFDFAPKHANAFLYVSDISN